MAENPEPGGIPEPPRPSLYQAALLIDQADNTISFERANSLAIRAIAHAVACQAIAAEQQAKILAGIRDRLDVLIRQNAHSNPRTLPPIPPFPATPPSPPTASAR